MPSMPSGSTCCIAGGAIGATGATGATGAVGGSGASIGGAGCDGKGCALIVDATLARLVRIVSPATPRDGSSYGREGWSSWIGSSGMRPSIGCGRDTCVAGGGSVGRGSAGPVIGAAMWELVKVLRSPVSRGARRRSRMPRRSTAAWKSPCGRSSVVAVAAVATRSMSMLASSRGIGSLRIASMIWSIDEPLGIASIRAGAAACGASGGRSIASAGRPNGTGGSSSVGIELRAASVPREESWCRGS